MADYDLGYAPITNATRESQVEGGYNAANIGLVKQQEFLAALQAQQGLSNQNNVFQQQQALSNQFGGVANGTGPNPVLAQFNQATGQNVANQAALMAGQRGTQANPGLIARQIAQQGAATQQQAAGQSATLQAQQQLAAMNAQAQQQAQMAAGANQMVNQQQAATLGLSQAAQSEQQTLLNALAAQNTANVQMQSNINSANAGIAQAGEAAHANIVGGLLNGAGAVAGSVLPGMFSGSAPRNNSNPSGVNSSPFGSGGIPGSESRDYTNLPDNPNPGGLAMGGMVKGYADGGAVDQPINPGGPRSFVGRFLTNQTPAVAPVQAAPVYNYGGKGRSGWSTGDSLGSLGAAALGAYGAFKGISGLEPSIQTGPTADPVRDPMENEPLLPSPEGNGDFAYAACGGMAQLHALGGGIPGKATVPGDSLSNDKVPAMLSPKEIVIPRSITMGKNAPEKAAAFVAKILAAQSLKRPS